ncbi:MAG: C45 family autoproteolytic acyltransferase/hydrolase [Promethearchaeia archaeon]
MLLFSCLLTFGLGLGIFLLLNFIIKRRTQKAITKLLSNWFHGFTGRFIKLKKAIAILFIICVAFGYSMLFYNISNKIVYHKNVGGFAEWRSSHGQQYLYVEADDHYGLGYLTGKAAAMKVYLMKDFFLAAALSMGLNYFSFIEIGKKYLDYIPQEYQEELQGIADGATAGSGFLVTFEDALIQSLFFEILYGQSQTDTDQMVACTAFGAINDDNTTIIGQNMDLAKPMKYFQYFVLHRLKNSPKVFTYRLGGCLSIAMGKNEHNLSIVMNLVQIKEKAELCKPSFVTVREGLAQDQLADKFYKTLFPEERSPFGLNYLIADNEKIIKVQARPDNIAKNYINSTQVHSNTYLNKNWRDALLDPGYSEERQEYSEGVLEESYEDGQITNYEILKILGDSPVICRKEEGLLGAQSMAFFTTKSFGCGTTNGEIGEIPI